MKNRKRLAFLASYDRARAERGGRAWLCSMRAAIEDFILFLATERGLSDNYQLSTRLSVEGFAAWLERRRAIEKIGEAGLEQLVQSGTPPPQMIVEPREVALAHISDYLAHCKRRGLSASSIKLVVVAIKILFRWLQVRGRIARAIRRSRCRCRASSDTCRRR